MKHEREAQGRVVGKWMKSHGRRENTLYFVWRKTIRQTSRLRSLVLLIRANASADDIADSEQGRGMFISQLTAVRKIIL
jgi:hypothetical protein